MNGKFDRRAFLGSTGALAGAFALARANPVLAAVRAPASANAVNVLVEVGGEFMPGEWLSGGNPYADVSSSRLGPDRVGQKIHGATRFEEPVVSVPLLRWKNLWPWLQEATAAQSTRRNASIALADPNGNTIHHLAISNAFITELRFPKADSSMNAVGQLMIKLAGDRYQFLASSRILAPRIAAQQFANQSSFLFQIQGLERDTSQAIWVTPPNIAIKSVPDVRTADVRNAVSVPGEFDIGPLKFSVPFMPGPISPLRQWCENALLNGRQERRAGLLSYLSPNRKDEVARIGFVDLLPSRFEIDQDTGGALRMNVDLSVRSVTAA